MYVFNINDIKNNIVNLLLFEIFNVNSDLIIFLFKDAYVRVVYVKMVKLF